MKQTCLFLLFIFPLVTGCASPITTESHPIFETGIDLESWVNISAGEFLMGQQNHEVWVDYDYEIMLTTVTNAQYGRYLNEALTDGTIKIVDHQVVGYYPGDEFRGFEHEEEIPAGDWLHVPLDEPGLRLKRIAEHFEALTGYENHPMIHVTWFGAKSYCEYYGDRLPTEVEWEKAARGRDDRPFPWGDKIENGNANYYSSHDLFEKIVGDLGDTTPVGFYNGNTYDGYQTIDSTSPYGLYDMAGNVWQWTGDIYEGIHYRYMRGGSKANYESNLRTWARNNATPVYHSPNVGFRCVREPSK
jgi:formylglycine-generating enzyme required for sulfatase activity